MAEGNGTRPATRTPRRIDTPAWFSAAPEITGLLQLVGDARQFLVTHMPEARHQVMRLVELGDSLALP
ncbi:hypothetical protein BH24ACT9_BH24ACT9_15790 [soil metagenome]|jgi:hypothetical protein